MDIDYEQLFKYAGMLLCISACIYLFLTGKKFIASLFLISFILQFQVILYIQFIGYPDNTGECWARMKSYYECLPLPFKLSMHAAQFGNYLMAVSVFMVGRYKN